MVVAGLIAAVALLILVLAAVRSPRTVLPARSQPARDGWEGRPLPSSWSGQGLGLPPYGPNSLGAVGRRPSLRRKSDRRRSPRPDHRSQHRCPEPTLRPSGRPGNRGQPVAAGCQPHICGSLSLLLLLLPGAVYTVALIARRGQTLGEQVMRLQVLRRRDGALPGWEVSARRWLLPAAPTLIRLAFPALGSILGLAVIVDFLWALWDPNRQCLHDKVADTLVVNTLVNVIGGHRQ
jgi:uncharacterized RDD family membrane protein YckC